MNKLGRKADSFASGINEHVRLGPKITDTVRGKLSLGARILHVGGVEIVFVQLFNVKDGERLLKASQCYLSTTSGPLAGLLFISTNKVAFCSERSIKISSPKGELIRIHYKVVIPLEKISCVNQSEHVKKPSQKYIEIVTVDNFDFWFMGFLNYQKAFKYLQKTISQALRRKVDLYYTHSPCSISNYCVKPKKAQYKYKYIVHSLVDKKCKLILHFLSSLLKLIPYVF